MIITETCSLIVGQKVTWKLGSKCILTLFYLNGVFWDPAEMNSTIFLNRFHTDAIIFSKDPIYAVTEVFLFKCNRIKINYTFHLSGVKMTPETISKVNNEKTTRSVQILISVVRKMWSIGSQESVEQLWILNTTRIDGTTLFIVFIVFYFAIRWLVWIGSRLWKSNKKSSDSTLS